MSLVLDKKNLETLLQQSSLYIRGKAKIKPVKWTVRNGELRFAVSSSDRTLALIGVYGAKFFEEISGEATWVFDAEKVVKSLDRVFKHTPMIRVYADNDKLVFEDKNDGRARLVVDQSSEEVIDIPSETVGYIGDIPVIAREGVEAYLYRADVLEIGRLEPRERITISFGEKVKAGGEIVKGSYAEIVVKSEPVKPVGEPVVADYSPQIVCPFAKKIKIGGVLGVHVDKDGEPGPLIVGEKQEDHVVVLWVLPLVRAE